MSAKRSKLLAPVVVLVLTLTAIAAVWLLVDQSSSSREAQLQVSSMRISLANLQSAPFSADPALGGSPSESAARIVTNERALSAGLTGRSQAGVPASQLASARTALGHLEPVVTTAYQLASAKGGLASAGATRVLSVDRQMQVRATAVSRALNTIADRDAARAAAARLQTKLGAGAVMLLLLAAFAYFYYRSLAARQAVERLVGEKEALLGVSRGEARTDALTNLHNRRALTTDLSRLIAEPPGAEELLLVMFDLDGFKGYNDTYGHPAGDSLLHLLGGRLADTAARHSGSAYRMGGDEFCVIARCSADRAEELLDETIAALTDRGEGWHIGCSQGAVWIPSEAATESQALKLADQRMYANKASRASASRQVSDALLQVIVEQDALLDDHVERVADLAEAVARAIGQPDPEVQRIRLAARLHDIGKTAIPAAILNKPGPLDAKEWTFMRRHSRIGERIVSAAPALADTAPLIRSSHERLDGHGYPDRLEGDSIPLGSRIISVCDAFDAMTSERAYRRSIGVDAALKELKRNAGSQFDPAIVEAFCEQIALRRSLAVTDSVNTVNG
jgi:diguanylate cyclase (GGDEF)-like protein